jgi:hypothetical protein
LPKFLVFENKSLTLGRPCDTDAPQKNSRAYCSL